MFTKTFIGLSSGKKIAYLAVFSAVMVLVNAFSWITLVHSFTAAAAFITGAMFGPVGGFSVCFVGDLIGCLIAGQAPNPLIMLATGMLGLIPGCIMTYIKGFFYLKAILSFALCLLICTAGINTFAIYFYYSSRSVSYFSYMFSRLPMQSAVMAVNCAAGIVLAKVLNRTKIGFKIS
ncbi:MAG: ECF transporter S component [Candidatus Borkfalkia sp.]